METHHEKHFSVSTSYFITHEGLHVFFNVPSHHSLQQYRSTFYSLTTPRNFPPQPWISKPVPSPFIESGYSIMQGLIWMTSPQTSLFCPPLLVLTTSPIYFPCHLTYHVLQLSFNCICSRFSAVPPTRMYASWEWRPNTSFPLVFPQRKALNISVQKQVAWTNKWYLASKNVPVIMLKGRWKKKTSS